jgi:hypothetical protein
VKITNKKNLTLALIIITIFATIAGCIGGDEPSKPKPGFTEVTGDWTESGWLQFDTQGNGGDSIVDETITVNINSTMIFMVTLEITFEDSDADNAETDEDSDPDTFSVKINSSGIDSEIATGQTPGKVSIQFPAANASAEDAEPVIFGPDINIIIHAECGGGKPYTPFTDRPAVGLVVYVDQGIYFDAKLEYHYAEEI